MVKIWRVEFGWNTSKVDVEAKTADEAMLKAREHCKKDIEREPEDYWISKVEVIAESDF